MSESEIQKPFRTSARDGGLVAFPTETVYGLGADATNPAAVAKIFAAKGRPATNPLIAHVGDEATAKRYAMNWSVEASKLVEAFWPGPLTMVVKKTPEICDAVTAGRGTVGLRMPLHHLAARSASRIRQTGRGTQRVKSVEPRFADDGRACAGGTGDLGGFNYRWRSVRCGD